MTHPPDSGLVPISGSVDFATREILRAAGDGNVSAGLRRALELPSTTLSGAQWIAHPALLPNPETADGPAVLAMPGGIVAHGVGPAGLIADVETSRLYITGISHEISTDLSIQALATLAAHTLPHADHHGHPIGAGLVVRRLSAGLVEFSVHGHPASAVVLPFRQALQLAAELAALLSRRVAQHQEQVARPRSCPRPPAGGSGAPVASK
jgi:hypothetical protein